jgi:RHS repeat-associated protein
MTKGLPLLISDGTNSYIYGPEGLPVEQVSSGGTVTYLHHDQQGSTRLLTGSTGTVTGSTTFDAYGNKTGSTGTSTTPLGYDGQYTSSDTGFVYLRARVYDPATAQFLTVDPLVGLTGAPYSYAGDNPLNQSDPTGLDEWEPWTESFWTEGNFLSNSPLNPIPYYEQEIESYENGCGYFASVAHGLEGTVVGTADVAGLARLVYEAGEGGYVLATRTKIGNWLFGRVTPEGLGTGPEGSAIAKGVLNRAPLRIGMGWRGDSKTGEQIFRIGVGTKHFDFFH